MKYKTNKISWLSLAAIIFTLIYSGCKEDDDLGMADRLFRPIISDTSYGGTWIRLVWDKYASANSYQLQLSTDTFQTILSEVETDTTFYRFDNLEYDTDYFIRIKSIGETLESDYFENDIIRTSDYPTKLENITSSDVIDTQVKVKWTDVSYDSLVVMSADTVFKTVVLTEANNTDKQVIIKALTAESDYIVKAFLDGGYQGKKSFSTIAPQVFDGDVLDLRGYSDEESYSMLNQTFFDQLAIDYPGGVTIVLSGGTKYELSGGIGITSPFSLVTGYTVNGKAIIEVNGNFDLPASATVGNVYFESLAFTDHPNKPKTTDSNYGGTYVMNISGSGSSLDSLLFEDCDIRYKRGVLRIKTGATVKAISFNNCFIDSISGYGVVNLDNSGVITNSISLTNSTISHTYLIVRADKASNPLQSFVASNLTIYKSGGTTGTYLFDLKNHPLTEKGEISNCIFGPGAAETLNGYRSASSTIKIQNNYRTSDCIWTYNVDANGVPTGDVAPIESTQLTETAAEIFGDVNDNDYTVTDSRLKDKIGDSRWW